MIAAHCIELGESENAAQMLEQLEKENYDELSIGIQATTKALHSILLKCQGDLEQSKAKAEEAKKIKGKMQPADEKKMLLQLPLWVLPNENEDVDK